MATEVLRPHDCLVRPVPSFRNPNPRPRKRREGSPRPPAKSHRQLQPATAMATAIATGHVTILRRGDPLLDANTKTTTTKKKKETERKKRTGGSDPAVPVVPRQIRLVAPAGTCTRGRRARCLRRRGRSRCRASRGGGGPVGDRGPPPLAPARLIDVKVK
ncbi:uncharacterized protein M6B38_208645 [Iris pallida]|uniref:Uncharacterized protein n=1 Tax=Iris pallida TaxID=29817 RepID=A0AAX6E5E7_IRIPA|nr:uncharacterized protein M6B38_208645 [Iris pallida]